jgi:ferredoxin
VVVTRVKVDPSKCQGHNRCFQLSEELFQLDEYGYASARGDGKVTPELAEKARLAVENCPERAISLVEED